MSPGHASALQAAPGQTHGPSPSANSPLDCLCPDSTLADERVKNNAAGQVVLKFKTAWRDGTTHLVMSPMQFMQRLAALVPMPMLRLIRVGVRITSLHEVSGLPLREHGVLAPSSATSAKLRALVVPQEVPQEVLQEVSQEVSQEVAQAPEPPAQKAKPAAGEANCAHHRPVRLSRRPPSMRRRVSPPAGCSRDSCA